MKDNKPFKNTQLTGLSISNGKYGEQLFTTMTKEDFINNAKALLDAVTTEKIRLTVNFKKRKVDGVRFATLHIDEYTPTVKTEGKVTATGLEAIE